MIEHVILGVSLLANIGLALVVLVANSIIKGIFGKNK